MHSFTTLYDNKSKFWQMSFVQKFKFTYKFSIAGHSYKMARAAVLLKECNSAGRSYMIRGPIFEKS